MSNAITGYGGLMKVGGTPSTVAEIGNWSVDTGAEEIDVTTLSSADAWKEFLAGLKEWGVSAEGNYYLGDTNGQYALWTAFVNRSTIAVELHFSNGAKLTGTCIVTGVPFENDVTDKAGVSFSLKGTGALTFTAAP